MVPPRSTPTSDRKTIETYFDTMPQLGASDIHIKAGAPVILRIAGQLRTLDMPPLTEEQTRSLAFSILTDEQRARFDQVGSVDFAHRTPKEVRVRVNVFRQRGLVSLAARYVNTRIPSFDELQLPGNTLKQLCNTESGLVIVAGPTGSGKTTTIAAMIDHINHSRKCHILTLEDPIEYVFADDKSIINQREIGIDTESFEDALRYALREDPDVIVMGEMRDAESVQIGLTAAETGHFVFGTLHAAAAPQAIGRILDLFPGDRQAQLRRSLGFNLRAVICQRLLRCTKKDKRRVPATEIMLCTPPVRKLIEDGEDERISEVMLRAREEGMVDFTHSLYDLVQQKLVTRQEALAQAPNPSRLQSLLDGLDTG